MIVVEVDLITLIGIALIFCSIVVVTSYLYFYTGEESCIKNPVEYANNHSRDYGWTEVVAVTFNP